MPQVEPSGSGSAGNETQTPKNQKKKSFVEKQLKLMFSAQIQMWLKSNWNNPWKTKWGNQTFDGDVSSDSQLINLRDKHTNSRNVTSYFESILCCV